MSVLAKQNTTRRRGSDEEQRAPLGCISCLWPANPPTGEILYRGERILKKNKKTQHLAIQEEVDFAGSELRRCVCACVRGAGLNLESEKNPS
jgi:hypothetical protein